MTIGEGAWQLRLAQADDTAALEALITRSAFGLSAGFYTHAQREALTREVFGVDSQLIADGTYFVIEDAGRLLACGGWGKRSTACGGDKMKRGPDRLLDPATEAAKIRAFFVAPDMARRGLGRRLMGHCERDAAAAGFKQLEMVATMPGVPLYRALGFALIEPYDLILSGGSVRAPVALMRRAVVVEGAA